MKRLSLLLPLLLVGCLGQLAREHQSKPALAGVVDTVVADAAVSPSARQQTLVAFSDAVKQGRHVDALALWPEVQAWAEEGIRLDPTLSEGARESLRVNLREFDLSLRQQVRP